MAEPAGHGAAANLGTPVLMVVQNQGVPPDVRIGGFGRMLAAAGYPVDVIAPSRRGQPTEEVVDGMRVHRFGEPPEGRGALGYAREVVASLWRIWRLRRRTGGVRHAILHLANPPDLLWLPFVGSLGSLVVVYDQHDLMPELFLAKGGKPGSPLYFALLGMERAAYAIADLVIVPNESYRRVALTRGHVDPTRVHVVRNAPDEAVWHARASRDQHRDSASVTLCYVGSTGTQDGVDQLLRALAHARDRTPKQRYRLKVAGSGDGLEGAKRLAVELGLGGSVEFLGWVSDQQALGDLVAAADIAIEPCPSNAFNDASTMVKLMNYLAVGRPIVAFDLPEHRATTGDAAVLVSPERGAAGLGDAIARLAEDVGERERLQSSASRRLSSAGLTTADAHRALLVAYEQARVMSRERSRRW